MELYINDPDIKTSKSSFSVYENESVKYESKTNKIPIRDLMIMILKNPQLMTALSYEVLDVLNKLKFATSRQITEYLNIIKKIDVSQKDIAKILGRLVKLTAISRCSYVSSEREHNTNMKVYFLDKNGQILLQSKKFKCNWKPTDILEMHFSKVYLIRNQFLIKLYKECSSITNLQLKSLDSGIGLTFTLKDKNYIIIPVRKYENYKETLLNTYRKLKTDPSLMIWGETANIILLGEDSEHLFQIFTVLVSNKDNYNNTLLNNNTYFLADLKLFDRELNKSFIQFGYKKSLDNKLEIVMKDVFLDI